MKEITPSELKAMIDRNEKFQIIDVREQYEIDLCNIGGTNINLYDILDRKMEIDKNKKFIIYCRSGKRSATAINILEKDSEFSNLYNLKGGINQWAKEVDSSITPY